jgi:hypothetical protein
MVVTTVAASDTGFEAAADGLMKQEVATNLIKSTTYLTPFTALRLTQPVHFLAIMAVPLTRY